MKRRYGYQPFIGEIAEMSADAVGKLIDLDKELVAKVTEGDDNPLFVTVEVLNESVSANGVYYDRDALVDICNQINKQFPNAYSGHIKPEDKRWVNPDPETIWLGARVVETKGKARLYAKGYVLPEATKRRNALKRAAAIGQQVSVSIYGSALHIKDTVKKAYRASKVHLESIDWARPGSEGVPGLGVFALTAEMREDINEGDVDMTFEEALQKATAEDLQKHNPDLVAEMQGEQVSEDDRKIISEMAAVTEIVGDDKPVRETVAEMQDRLREYELDEQLESKVSDAKARKVVKRMVISEMKKDEGITETVDRVLAQEDTQAVIAEMTATEPTITPKVEAPSAPAEKTSYIKKKGQ